LLDIIVQFNTTFFDPLSGEEVFDKVLIKKTYLKGRFIIDFLSTVPFDVIVQAITGEKISILPLLSLLKLIRVTRISRIIESMNVKEQIKLMMKLCQLIFYLIIYIHCLGCLWFFIVRQDKVWRPPVEEINPNSDIWVPPDEYGNFDEYSTIAHKYFLCIYYSILLLTCNDILPPDEFKIFFCTFALFLGAIINANIFGNLALIITNLNAKNTEFQHSIDLANTSMYNMNMPSDIQKDVIAYL
jgi:hypothetical protein